ncbi:MAG TPA: GNAT family protein [Bacteroidota bacterium]
MIDPPAGSLIPVVLSGKHVELHPLSLAHAADLSSAIAVDDLWKLGVSDLPAPRGMEAYIAEALALQSAGKALPFALIDKSAGRAVGSTRFGNFEPAHRRVEIGWTWLGTPWQLTAFNTEAKYLLLSHAFEGLGLNRVEFKTDVLNERSRKAILRLGALEEGVLRRHMVMRDGRVRDSVYYSIIAEEWPVVKENLRRKMSA